MKEDELIRYVSDGFDKAKQGQALEMYSSILPYAAAGQLPLKSHYPFGWIIYYALHQSPDHDILIRKKMLAVYLKLRVVKPHKLHSMILTEAIRLYKDAKNAAFNKKKEEVQPFSVVKFVRLWQLTNLRPGDWRRKEFDGKLLSSTVEKLITVCVDELEETREMPADEFVEIVEKALAEYPDTAGLLAQRAALHVLANDPDQARDVLRKALIVAPNKFYLWSRLASLISVKENERLHMALLYKALCAPGQEQFKGRIHLALAQAWLARNMHSQAKWELEKVKCIYDTNGWHLPKAFAEAEKELPGDTVAQDPGPFYRKVEPLADDEVYDTLPEIRVTKNYHKIPNPKAAGFGRPAVAWRVADENGTNYWLQPHRFGIDPELPIGTSLMIRVHGKKPVKGRLIN